MKESITVEVLAKNGQSQLLTMEYDKGNDYFEILLENKQICIGDLRDFLEAFRRMITMWGEENTKRRETKVSHGSHGNKGEENG